MISELINKFPGPVARPYLLIKDDLQRKDMQRFWFENTISFLAILSAAELVRYYQELKQEAIEAGDNEKAATLREKISEIQNNKSLTMVGLEHMALGKWVMMLRETTRVLQEYGAAKTVPEIVEFYHGKHGKENAKIIDTLVSIRNDDAHGNPIPEEKLSKELDRRQEMIDSLTKQLSFMENYQLILPEKLEIEGSSQYYICRQFIGNGVVSTKQNFDFSPRLSEVMLLNKKVNSAPLFLDPLLLYLGVQDEENNFIGIFSKFTSKDKTEAKYLNLDGSANIDLINFGQENGLDLIKERQPYDEIYSDPESFQANLDVRLILETDNLQVDETGSFSLEITNKKSTDIEEARVVLTLPGNFEIVNVDELKDPKETLDIEVKNGQLVIALSQIEDDTTIDIPAIKFKISEQGTFTIDDGVLFYSYYKTLADKESGNLTEEESSFGGAVIEVLDPNSRDKMLPVINVNKEFVDTEGNPVKNVKIGEDFIFRVTVTNIGFSSAKDVLIDLVFPSHLNLRKGKETIRLSLLNPFEDRTFEYVLNSKIPDIYTLSMQNIVYSDLHGRRYKTACADEHFIIVRSDRIKEFTYMIRDHIDDLYIDEDEKKNISQMIDDLKSSTGIDAYKIYQEAETEAVINIIRELIEKTAKKRNLSYVESIYEERKRDSKITNVPPRKFLVFSSKEMPFFAVNLSKGYEPEFYALRTTIDKRFDKVKVKQAVVGEGSYTLDHSVDFSEIKYDKNYGMKHFFSQWINIVITRFSREYLTWRRIVDELSKFHNSTFSYQSGAFVTNQNLEEGEARSSAIFIDRENPMKYYIAYDASPTTNYKEVIQNTLCDKPYFTFLNESMSDKTRLYDSRDLSYYRRKSDSGRITKTPAITVQLRNPDDSLDDVMSRTRELWESLCLAHSLNLLEREPFNHVKNYTDKMREFTFKLHEKGFAFRENTKNHEMLDIYPVRDFLPKSAQERDCIGFIKKYYSNWQIYLDFFEDIVDENLKEYLKLDSSPYVADRVRWIYTNIGDEEQFDLITQTILRQADIFKPSSLAIWPKRMQKSMIMAHGQTDSGFFILLKNLTAGKTAYREILDDFKSYDMEMELDRTLQQNELFESKAGYESPLLIEGSLEDRTIRIKPFLDDTLSEMSKEKPKFDYMEEGPALFRIYSIRIAQAYPPLKKRKPGASGFLDFSKRIKSKITNICWIGINPIKGKTIEFYAIYKNCSKDNEKLISDSYKKSNEGFYEKLVFERSGHKKQHYRVSYKYIFEDFDMELDNIRETGSVFFRESEKVCDSLDEE